MKIVTKLNTFIISLLGSLTSGYFLFTNPEQISSYKRQTIAERCYGFLWADALLVFIPIFIFSLITCKMKNGVFKPWVWFSIVFASIYITLFQEQHMGGNGWKITFSWYIDSLTLFAPYIIISTIIIGTQLFRTRTKK